MSLLSKANEQVANKVKEEAKTYIPNIKIGHPMSPSCENEDVGKWSYEGTVLTNKITITPIAIRSNIIKKRANEMATSFIITPIVTAEDILHESEDIAKYIKVADIEGMQIQKNVDVLCYVAELDSFAVIVIKESSYADFLKLNEASEETGSCTIETETVVNKKGNTFFNWTIEQTDTLEVASDKIVSAKKVYQVFRQK